MNAFFRFVERLNAWAGIITGISILIMVVTITWAVVARYFLSRPPNWSFDLNTDLLVFLTYLGAGYTLLVDGHVKVDIFYSSFSRRRKEIVNLVACLVGLTYVVILIWQGWLQACGSFGLKPSASLPWSLFYVQLLVPLGCALVGLQFVVKALNAIRYLAVGEKVNIAELSLGKEG